MDENLKNTIIDLTTIPLIVDWLELCGFENLQDIETINDKVIKDIETYVGTVCNLMSVEDREKYLHMKVFQSDPSQFKFPPSWKNRLLQAINVLKQEKIQSQITSDPPIIENGSIAGCVSCSEDLHDFVSKKIKKRFRRIHHQDDLNFELFQSELKEETNSKYGYLSCSIDNSDGICGQTVKFYFKSENSIDLDPIMCHMKTHFSPLTRISGGNTQCLSLPGNLPSNRSLSCSVDLADAKLCDISTHDEVIKVANLKFIDCHLVRDIDFNIFEIVNDDSSVTNRGCFICYLCLKSKSIEKKIKFFFTSNRSVISSNIIAHLRRHFQSVAPSVLQVTKTQKSLENFSFFAKGIQDRESIFDNPEIKLELVSNKENII